MRKHIIALLFVAMAVTACTTNNSNPSASETETIVHTELETPTIESVENTTELESQAPDTTPAESSVEIIELEYDDPLEDGAKMISSYQFLRGDDNYCYLMILFQPKSNGKIEYYLKKYDRMRETDSKVVIGEYLENPILAEENLFTFSDDVIMSVQANDQYIIVTYDGTDISVYEASTPNSPVKLFTVKENDM